MFSRPEACGGDATTRRPAAAPAVGTASPRVPWTAAVLAVALGTAGCGGLEPLPAEREAALPRAVVRTQAERARADRLATEGLAAWRRGDADAAVRRAEAALEIDPRQGLARALRGAGWMVAAQAERPPALDLWQRAEGMLRQARQLAPDDPDVAVLHADFLIADEHLVAAAAVLDEALAVAPDHLPALRRAGALRYELREERAAVPLLERQIALEEDLSERAVAGHRLAHCRLRLAESTADEAARSRAFVLAAEAFRNAARWSTRDVDLELGIAHALMRARETAPADRLATLDEGIDAAVTRAEELAPGAPAPAHARGLHAVVRDDPAAAERAWRAALERDPRHLPTLLELAALLVETERENEAERLYRRVLDLEPTSDERQAIEAWLAGREG